MVISLQSYSSKYTTEIFECWSQIVGNLLTALAVGNNGAIYVSWVVDTGKWQGPVQITPIVKYPNLAKTAPNYPRFEYPKFPQK